MSSKKYLNFWIKILYTYLLLRNALQEPLCLYRFTLENHPHNHPLKTLKSHNLTTLLNYVSSNSRHPTQFASWTKEEQQSFSCQSQEISLLSREFRTAFVYPIWFQTDITLAHISRRGEFKPRQTRQLPRAVDLKGRLLSCQSY